MDSPTGTGLTTSPSSLSEMTLRAKDHAAKAAEERWRERQRQPFPATPNP